MVTTRRFEVGSRSGPGAGGQGGSAALDDRIREILHDRDQELEVVPHFRSQLPEMFKPIKTAMMEYFDERYCDNPKFVLSS